MAIQPDEVTWPLPRPVLSAGYAAGRALSGSSAERVWALSDAELTRAMGVFGALSGSVAAHLVVVLAEAKRRGLGGGGGWGPVDWARAAAPQLGARALADLDAVAGAADEPRLVGVLEAVACARRVEQMPPEGDVEGDVEDDVEGDQESGVAAGEQGGERGGESDSARVDGLGGEPWEVLPVGKAAQIVRFHQGMRGMADPDQLEEVTATLVGCASGVDGLGERELAAAVRHAGNVMRPDRWVEHDVALRRAHRALVKSPGPVGMCRYTLLLEEEGSAVLDAAVDALAKPQPDPDSGERDPRTPAARRADALLDLVGRAVSAPEGVARQAKTSLVVTIGLEALQGACRGSGVTPAGEVLSAGTVRRLACDAQVIPVVLGSRAEVLEQGQAQRLFTPGQVRHLWLRDQGCSFPGCSKPPAWADAHHLVHWVDHGPTDIGNAALLCRAHHTVVHTDRLAGHVDDGPHGPRVRWDLTPGSYDTHLQQWQRRQRPNGVGAEGMPGRLGARPPLDETPGARPPLEETPGARPPLEETPGARPPLEETPGARPPLDETPAPGRTPSPESPPPASPPPPPPPPQPPPSRA